MGRKGEGREERTERAATRGAWLSSSAVLSAVIVMMAVLGAGIMLYPSLADIYNRVNASQTITGYDRAVEQKSEEERERLWQEAETYNEELADETLQWGGTIDFWDITEEQDQRYQGTLRVEQEGLMGSVLVPAASIDLPIGHGIDERVLQMEVGHLEGSSLPVGGASTHCVLTGHTGLPSARLFTDLVQVKVGDTFTLRVLGRELTYEVFQIQVVLPDAVDSLRIEEGQDLCTLLTCTPYGINDHRLLVTGRRVETPVGEQASQQAGLPVSVRFLIGFLIAVLVLVTVWLVLRKRGERRRKHASDVTR